VLREPAGDVQKSFGVELVVFSEDPAFMADGDHVSSCRKMEARWVCTGTAEGVSLDNVFPSTFCGVALQSDEDDHPNRALPSSVTCGEAIFSFAASQSRLLLTIFASKPCEL